jgi:hypothetical protein
MFSPGLAAGSERQRQGYARLKQSRHMRMNNEIGGQMLVLDFPVFTHQTPATTTIQQIHFLQFS